MANDHTQNDREQKSGGVLTIVVIVLGIVMLPVLYVFGIGPAVWLHKRGIATEAIEAFYGPLVASIPYLGPFALLLEWYARLWE